MTIEASHISFRYGDKPVLKEVSFALTSGRFHAFWARMAPASPHCSVC